MPWTHESSFKGKLFLTARFLLTMFTFSKNRGGAQDFAFSTSSPYIYEHNRGVQQKIPTRGVQDFLLNTSVVFILLLEKATHNLDS